MKKLFTYFIFICLFIMLSACGSKIEYVLCFDSNGGSDVSSLKTDGKSIIQMPDDPLKERYSFAGWYFDNETFEVIFTANSFVESPIKRKITVYAKWVEEYQAPLKVIFNSMGGTEIADVYVLMGSTLNAPLTTKKGQSFEGWYTSKNGGIILDEKWSLELDVVNSDLTLYAKWITNQYTITYAIVSDEFHKNLDIPLYTGETIVRVFGGANHSSAITSIGRVFMWGSNFNQELGTQTYWFELEPVDITNKLNLSVGETINHISLGSNLSSVITSKGRIIMIGNIDKGNPENFITDITNRFNLNKGESVVQLSLGGSGHYSAITSKGRVFTWGLNSSGQLGDGTKTDKPMPIDITNNFNLNEGETITQVSLGYSHSSAITSSGRFFTWGSNKKGELGDGTIINIPFPIDITNRFDLVDGETVTKASLGDQFSSVITSNGRVLTWGNNYYGQLGDGTTIDKLTPVDITNSFNLNGGETINNISAGGYHLIANTSRDRVFTWGCNDSFQLSFGAIKKQLTPIDISSNFNLNDGETITQIATGGRHSLAFTSTGSVLTWGNNVNGQLGDGTIAMHYVPTKIEFVLSEYIYSKTVNIYNELITQFTLELKNHTFSGWYSDSLLTNLYTFTTMPDKDVTLYGYWIKDE